VKARPIIFTGPMVRALLDGRKSQTRRIVKPQPAGEWAVPGKSVCPYGVAGDLLWVRENLYQFGGPIEYAADPGMPSFKRRQTPSIHMPRHASRVTLKITAVRVERLQEITQSDTVAEGMPVTTGPFVHHTIADFRKLWGTINGAESWDANPWVWVVAFTTEKRNVDAIIAEARAA
jgi:hypothetical protein